MHNDDSYAAFMRQAEDLHAHHTAPAGAPVYVLVQPDGRAAYGHDLEQAKKAMGPYGNDSGFIDSRRSRLRLMTSDVALILTDQFPPNPYASAILHTLAGLRPEDATYELRGPVALYYYDSFNEWNSSRPMSDEEKARLDAAVTAAGCTLDEAGGR